MDYGYHEFYWNIYNFIIQNKEFNDLKVNIEHAEDINDSIAEYLNICDEITDVILDELVECGSYSIKKLKVFRVYFLKMLESFKPISEEIINNLWKKLQQCKRVIVNF